MATERALLAAETRARGAEAAKAMALGNRGGGIGTTAIGAAASTVVHVRVGFGRGLFVSGGGEGAAISFVVAFWCVESGWYGCSSLLCWGVRC